MAGVVVGRCSGSYRRPSTAWMVNKNKIYFWWIYFTPKIKKNEILFCCNV